MISHGVEISITGGVGGMVRGYILVAFFFFFFFCYHVLFVLGTKSLRQLEL